MAIAVSQVIRERLGQRTLVVADVTFDSSYPTGGEPITATDFALTALEHIQAAHDPATGKKVTFDRANGKMKIFTAGSTEAANASDQSAVVVRVTAFGQGG